MTKSPGEFSLRDADNHFLLQLLMARLFLKSYGTINATAELPSRGFSGPIFLLEYVEVLFAPFEHLVNDRD